MKISLAALALVGATVQAQELRGGLSDQSVAGRLLKGEPVTAGDSLYLCVNQANHVRGVAASAEDCDHFAGDDLQDNITPFLIQTESGGGFGTAIAQLQTDVNNNDGDITGLRTDVSTLQDGIGLLDNPDSSLQTQITSNAGDIAEVQGAIVDVKDDVQEAFDQVQDAFKTLFDATGVVLLPNGNFPPSADSLQYQITANTGDIAEVQGAIVDVKDDVQGAFDQVTDTFETLIRATGVILNNDGTFQGDTLQRQITENHSTVAILKSNVDTIKGNVGELVGRVALIEQDTALEDKVGSLEVIVSDLSDRFSTISDQLDALEDQIDSNVFQILSLFEEIDTLIQATGVVLNNAGNFPTNGQSLQDQIDNLVLGTIGISSGPDPLPLQDQIDLIKARLDALDGAA